MIGSKKGLYRRITGSSKAIVSVIIALAALAFILGTVFFVTGKPEEKTVKPGGVTVSQEKLSLHAEWNGSGEHTVTLIGNMMGPKTYHATGGSIDIPIYSVPDKYDVIVVGDDGVRSGAVIADKLVQHIKSRKTYEVVRGKTVKIDAEAKGDIVIDAGAGITSDKSGKVKGDRVGETEVTVKAKETEFYKPEDKEVKVTVYPDKLTKTKIKVTERDETAVLTWDDVDFAKEYEVSNGVTTLKTEKTKIKVPREKGTYRVRAVAKVNDEKIVSAYSNKASVSSVVEKAKSYGSITTLTTLTGDDFDEVAYISGSGSAVIPQSFSYADDKFVVSFVGKDGKAGSLISYSEDGERLEEHSVSMGHANGSTYDPNTGKIYTVKTHYGIKSSDCTAFSLSDYESSSYKLPRVTSGIAFDESNGKFYLSGGPKIMVTDGDFNSEKVIYKKRYNKAQDVGAYDGACFTCVWEGGNRNHIDIYRIADGAYLGSYDVPIGEIESAVVVDRHLYLLVHNGSFNGKGGNHIIRMKDVVLK